MFLVFVPGSVNGERMLTTCGVDFSGQTGLGKSTLVNTIFASHLVDSKGRLESDEPVRQTTEIQAVSHGACSKVGVVEAVLTDTIL